MGEIIDMGQGYREIRGTWDIVDMNQNKKLKNRLIDDSNIVYYLGNNSWYFGEAMDVLLDYKNGNKRTFVDFINKRASAGGVDGHDEYLNSLVKDIITLEYGFDSVSRILRCVATCIRLSNNIYRHIIMREPDEYIVRDVMELLDRLELFNSIFTVEDFGMTYKKEPLYDDRVSSIHIAYGGDMITSVRNDPDANNVISDMTHYMRDDNDYTFDDVPGLVLAKHNKPIDLIFLIHDKEVGENYHSVVFNPLLNKVFVWTFEDVYSLGGELQ